MIIGITGSSGAGKSTVCEILERKYGIQIINADKIAKQLSKKGTKYLTDIVKQFGEQILLENGELNRKKLAEIIYSNHEKREQLNSCTLKHIKKEIQKEIEELNNSIENSEKNDLDCANNHIIVIDAPLLFEAKLEELCKFVVAVISDNKELQIQRIVKRDSITKEQAKARLNAQKPNEFYTSRSKYIIVNNGELEEVEKQINQIFAKIA